MPNVLKIARCAAGMLALPLMLYPPIAGATAGDRCAGGKLAIVQYEEYAIPVCSVSPTGTGSPLAPPGTPGAVSAPSLNHSGNYTVSWGAATGLVGVYELYENGAMVFSGSDLSAPLSGRDNGTYRYAVRACNAAGCSANTADAVVTVDIRLSDVIPDAPLVAPDVPAQGWVGTLPGTPSTDGGSAGYQIPIDVPPGRLGMQPHLALAYSSRNGNGIAGVGWSVSGLSSIYRCPRTLEQENGGAPVRYSADDRLCMDGKRLVQPSGDNGSYGMPGTEYRTEIDEFARITQAGNLDFGASFKVEHKSGLTTLYAAGMTQTSWLPSAQYDRQGNCVFYEYQLFNERANGELEWVLSRIVYTGTMSGSYCSTGPGARAVEFEYTSDRPDKRTTYLAGRASTTTARLAAIVTKVGTKAVRRYELGYRESAATHRSLLSQVQLCAGATCGVAKLPPTQFTYQEDPPAFAAPKPVPGMDGGSLDQNWRVSVVGDYDGDGTRDLVYAHFNGTSWPRTLQLSKDKSQTDVNQAFVGLNNPAQWASFEAGVDIDEDGRSDLLGWDAAKGKVIVSSFKNGKWGSQETNIPLASSGFLGAMRDVDGDGRVDIGIGGTLNSWSETIYRKECNDGLGCFVPAGVSASSRPPGGWVVPLMSRDFNGDGLEDAFFDRELPGDNVPELNMQISPGSFLVKKLNDLGGPNDSFSRNEGRRWIDVNGDGLPDIYDPRNGFVYVNRGGIPGTGMFSMRRLTSPALVLGRANLAFVMDVDADGEEELMIPEARTIDYCGGDPTRYSLSGEQYWWCGNEFDIGSTGDPYDHSVFRWDAYKFRERSDGSYEMVLIGMPVGSKLQAPVRMAQTVADWPRLNGDPNWHADGLSDVGYLLVEQFGTTSTGKRIRFGFYPSLSVYGPYVSMRQGRAPDLLIGATNGLGATAAWEHQPLSNPTAPQGCDTGAPFYVAHHDDPHPAGYVFFTSAMWAVAKFDVSNGVSGAASPTNTTCYRYEDAMLNSRGRGFQGFKKIVAEERLPPALGEGTGVAGPCGTGTCSANNLRTTTLFNQKFPLTNRVEKVTVERVSDSKLISTTTTTWNEVAKRKPAVGVPNLWRVSPSVTVTASYDLAAAPGAGPLVTKTQVSEVDTDSGEAKVSCSIVDDGLNATLSLETRKLWSDENGWWLGRVDELEKVADYLPTPWSLRKPVCPDRPQSQDEKVFRVTYKWFEDSTGPGFNRQLHYEAVLPGATGTAEESRTTFGYDLYGNVASKEVTARGVLDASGAQSVLTTTYVPSAGGYFPETETNPLLHVSTTKADPATGNLVYRQAVQGGPVTRIAYDELGRVLSTTTDGSQPVYERLADCPSCGDARISHLRIQAGAPTQTEFFDRLGRVIETQTQGLGGETIVASLTAYNERGHKVSETAPRFETDTTGYTTEYSGFDALGRVGRKTVYRSAPPPRASLIATDYEYRDLKTMITVKGVSAQSALEMSRTYDGRGKLVETTQRVSKPSAHDVTVSYGYDPAGRVTRIQTNGSRNGAPIGATITADYDDLGRKRWVDDPDRGRWTYGWDGLGRVRQQKDAKGTLTEMDYDAIGRPIERHTTESGKTRLLDALWTYDRDGKLGTLSSEEGASGDATAITTGDYRREYRYDSLFRVEKVTTTADVHQATSRTFTTLHGYDKSYGRQKGMKYPSGEMVTFDYGTFGHAVGEAEIRRDGTRGKHYRLVRGMSARGQVTDEVLGNCVAQYAKYDGPAGLVAELTATTSRGLSSLPADLAQCPAQALGQSVRLVDYTYDDYLNLVRQEKNVRWQAKGEPGKEQSQGTVVTETFEYDELQRLTRAKRSWIGATTGNEESSYDYDDLGNLTSKSDYGTQYRYGDASRATQGAGPHAVAQVATVGGGTATFDYDPNGNQISGDGRTITFDAMDRVTQVTQAASATTTSFAYAPDGSRYRQRVTGPAEGKYGPKTVYYVDKDYELVVWADGRTEERTYVGGSVVVYRGSSGAREVRYEHKDRLGSLDAVTADDVGATELYADAHGFDPWGKPRGRDWTSSGDRLHAAGDMPDAVNPPPPFACEAPDPIPAGWTAPAECSRTVGVTTDRGFTGHEHLDAHYLIHMNGRVYDYRLGRFLSVDPIISNPLSSQAINPYSYIGNNPLSGVDPTGYAATSVCSGSGGASNCTVIQVASPDPNQVVGIKWTTTTTTPDGRTTTSTRIQWLNGNGAGGAVATLANTNPTEHLGPRDVGAGRQTNWRALAKGVVFGALNALLPGTSLFGLPPGLQDDPDAVAGQGIGQLATGIVQAKVAADMTVGGAVGGVVTSETGVGALAGATVSAGGLVLGGVAVANVGQGVETLGRAMEMRGSGSGGQPEKGVGGSGWRGDGQWRRAVRQVGQGGTIEHIGGRIPTASEARALIKESGGTVLRTEPPHPSPNPHNFPHMNYTTAGGVKGTIRISE